MALSTKPYKGTRDFYPEDMRLRNWMFSVMRQACESYGYEEYDAPVLEPLDLYLSKTSEEVVNEQSYSFTDRGDRKVIIIDHQLEHIHRQEHLYNRQHQRQDDVFLLKVSDLMR